MRLPHLVGYLSVTVTMCASWLPHPARGQSLGTRPDLHWQAPPPATLPQSAPLQRIHPVHLTQRPPAPVQLVNHESPGTLPNEHGQIWQEYDIRAYTQRTPNKAKPEQAIIDWILRETGTEVWFSEPLGLLSANRGKLVVYHTPEIQAAVADIVHRFARPETDKNVFGVRMITVTSPNWRTKLIGMLTPVVVQTPGVEAWLLSRENAAVVMDELRKRTDSREYGSPNLLIRNGQTHSVQRQRPVTYIKGIHNNPSLAGNYQTELGQVEEGFTLRLSPLLSGDKRAVDAVLRVEASQVEKMIPIDVPTPSATDRRQMSQVQVPQTSSWRLHERFRWPVGEVLLISCGVVASPGPEPAGPLGMRPLVRGGLPRADALVFVESKGRLNENVASSQGEERYQGLNYRGRY